MEGHGTLPTTTLEYWRLWNINNWVTGWALARTGEYYWWIGNRGSPLPSNNCIMLSRAIEELEEQHHELKICKDRAREMGDWALWLSCSFSEEWVLREVGPSPSCTKWNVDMLWTSVSLLLISLLLFWFPFKISLHAICKYFNELTYAKEQWCFVPLPSFSRKSYLRITGTPASAYA